MELHALTPTPPPEERLTKTERIIRGSLFILSGLFIVFGFGYASENIIPDMCIGLGIGFTAFAISLYSRR